MARAIIDTMLVIVLILTWGSRYSLEKRELHNKGILILKLGVEVPAAH